MAFFAPAIDLWLSLRQKYLQQYKLREEIQCSTKKRIELNKQMSNVSHIQKIKTRHASVPKILARALG